MVYAERVHLQLQVVGGATLSEVLLELLLAGDCREFVLHLHAR